MSSVTNPVVVITGASAGIGAATARLFGQRGARVVLAARRVGRLETLAQEIRAAGAEALVIPADLSQLADIQNLVQHTLAHFGRIDVLFNNAGFGRLDWLENLDPVKDIEAQLAVNVLGVVQTTRAVLPSMQQQRRGHIINMASMAGLVGTPTYSIYAASKFAVRGFSEALRREVTPWGVRVSVIYPGGVATEFAAHAGIRRKTRVTTPRWLLLTPADVARAVVRLTERPRAEVVIPFGWRFSVWLNQVLPGLVDWVTINRFTKVERKETLRYQEKRTEGQ